MEDDPFTKVYDALWQMMERNNDLLNLIKPQNRIKFGKRNELKREVSTADLPELTLMMVGGSWNFQFSSSHSQLLRVYSWMVTTGDFTASPYNAILWELCRAMVDWDKYICAVQWRGAQVVRNANQAELEEGTFNTTQNRGIEGWSAIWSLNVEFWVPTELMRIQ